MIKYHNYSLLNFHYIHRKMRLFSYENSFSYFLLIILFFRCNNIRILNTEYFNSDIFGFFLIYYIKNFKWINKSMKLVI